MIANRLARFRRRKLAVVALEPQTYVKEINLFAPEHSGERLPLNHSFFFVRAFRMD